MREAERERDVSCPVVFLRQVYAANALLEWQTERTDKIPRNIFELGLKAHMGQTDYVIAYADWLLSIGAATLAHFCCSGQHQSTLGTLLLLPAHRPLMLLCLRARETAPKFPGKVRSKTRAKCRCSR